MESNKLEWLKDYQRIKENPVFFIEKYYNHLYHDNKICLTDEEKQHVFDNYRSNLIPMLDDTNMRKHFEWQDKIKELKKQGHKDWEIF
jgi:ATP-dependent exoDNAse (exonuclease V) alpha subunit